MKIRDNIKDNWEIKDKNWRQLIPSSTLVYIQIGNSRNIFKEQEKASIKLKRNSAWYNQA